MLDSVRQRLQGYFNIIWAIFMHIQKKKFMMKFLVGSEQYSSTGCPRMFYTQKWIFFLEFLLQLRPSNVVFWFIYVIGPYCWLSREFWIKEIGRVKLKLHDIM